MSTLLHLHASDDTHVLAVDHFSAAVESQPSVHRLALCRRSVTGRGSSKAVHHPKDEENFSSLH